MTWYGEMLRPLARSCAALPTTPGEIEAVLVALGPVSDVTRFDVWVAMRVFFRWCARRYALPANPMDDVARPRRLPKLREALTEPQVLRVMAAALSRRDKALLTVLLDTGMRLGEAHSLTWPDVGPEVVRVDGKVGRREIPMTEFARWCLMGVDLPWRGRRGQLTVTGLGRVVRRCMRRAGVHRGGAHLLRHTFARMYLHNGGDVFSLQRILGHRSLTTTRVYLELDMTDVIERHRRYSPIVRLLERAAGDPGARLSPQGS